MKKVKMLLSLVVMLGLATSLFAEEFLQDAYDTIFSPQKSSVYNDDIMVIYDIETHQQDFAFYERNFPEPERDFNKRFLENKLNKMKVTDQQMEDFKNLQEESKKEINDLTKKFKSKIKFLNNEFFKENYGTKEVKNLAKEIKSITAKIIDSTIERKEALRKILTSKQYNNLFKPKTKYDVLADRLDLSEEQKGKIIKLIEAKRENEKPLRQQLKEDEALIKQEFEKDIIDMEVITKLSDEISNISKELLKLNLDLKVELKSILSPEQYKKLSKTTRSSASHESTDSNKNLDKK
ncbi:MAG: Spy/CpxP family protein refolding chaperone [Elusimicrobia bacterium]|nr:Spy/CpxP family protein refolding chaperone [Elusimicrobiota bacterium]